MQEELPAAAAAAGARWEEGTAERPFQPQEAELVQELREAPAGTEDRRGRAAAERAKSSSSPAATAPSASPPLQPPLPPPQLPEASDVTQARQRQGEQSKGHASPQEHQPVPDAREVPDAAHALRLSGQRQRQQQLRQRHGAHRHGLVPGRPGERQGRSLGQSQRARLQVPTGTVPGGAGGASWRGESADTGGQHAVFPL